MQHGADVDQADFGGLAALSCACEMGYVDVARLLLENGASVHLCDEEGGVPLTLASADVSWPSSSCWWDREPRRTLQTPIR